MEMGKEMVDCIVAFVLYLISMTIIVCVFC